MWCILECEKQVIEDQHWYPIVDLHCYVGKYQFACSSYAYRIIE